MPDIGAADLTYTIRDRGKVRGETVTRVAVAFGNGALTYPAGGITLEATKLGMPSGVIKAVELLTRVGGGVVWDADQTTATVVKLRAYYQEPTNATAGRVALLEAAAASTAPAATTLVLEARGQ